jgi:hypothetical protein
LLELVEDDKEPVITQDPGDHGEPGDVISPGMSQYLQVSAEVRAARTGRRVADCLRDCGEQGGRAPPAVVDGDQPALVAQPRDDPPGEGGLADAADPGQDDAAGGAIALHGTRRPAQHAHRLPQLGPAPDQRAQRQLAHPAPGRRRGHRRQTCLGGGQVDQRPRASSSRLTPPAWRRCSAFTRPP